MGDHADDLIIDEIMGHSQWKKDEKKMRLPGDGKPARPQRTKPLTLVVTMALPLGVTMKEAADYVRSAVKSHVGSLDPEDPMASLNTEAIQVRRPRTL